MRVRFAVQIPHAWTQTTQTVCALYSTLYGPDIPCVFAACRVYGESVRKALFWWGGALTPLQREAEDDSSSADEEPAAKVSVVLPGDAAAGADCTPEAKQQS